ncbi:gliding motility-associated protein GldE [Niabella terrae]
MFDTAFITLIAKGWVILQLPATTQSSTLLIIGLIVLVFLSFSISGSQAAVFSLDEKDIDVLKTRQQPAARRILDLLEKPKAVFASMLIAKTIINILLVIVSNYLINQYTPPEYFHNSWAILGKWLLIAFLILFPLEIFPRVWARQNSLRFAYEWPVVIMIVEGIHMALRRISEWVVSISDGLGRGIGANNAEANSIEELDAAIDVQTDDEASPEEKKIMKGIVKFGQISVKKIMRSRLYVNGIELKTSFADLVKKIESLHYSRLPVYRENLDEIEGVLNTKDVVPFLYEPDFNWHDLIRPPFFVPESKLIEDLLLEFQKKRTHFAIVVDEFGGTSGIVTMEDIVEEVVGDIKDEFDEEENNSTKIDDKTYLFEGNTRLLDVCRAMSLPLNTFDDIRGDSETLGGLMNELAGDLPQLNDTIQSGDFEFTVLEIERNRAKQIKIIVK